MDDRKYCNTNFCICFIRRNLDARALSRHSFLYLHSLYTPMHLSERSKSIRVGDGSDMLIIIIEVQLGDRNATFACDRIKQVNIVILNKYSRISQLIHVSIGNAPN